MKPSSQLRRVSWSNPAELSPATAQLAFWYEATGEMPQQHPEFLLANLTRTGPERAALFLGESLALAFRDCGEGVWESLLPAAPILAAHLDHTPAQLAELTSALAAARRALDATVLYFPLCYPQFGASQLLRAAPGTVEWPRSSSPVIDWSDQGAGLTDRFRERHGPEHRKKERFWDRKLTLARVPAAEAAEVVARVEPWSWKAESATGLLDRGELAYHERLLASGRTQLSAALRDGEPVAYRIEARHQERLYCLEWSYDRRAARLSPGMFLVVRGLSADWQETPLDAIDLFGAPDLLKILVETDRQPRLDLAWTDLDTAAEPLARLRTERLAHDCRLADGLAHGRGLPRLYPPGQ